MVSLDFLVIFKHAHCNICVIIYIINWDLMLGRHTIRTFVPR